MPHSTKSIGPATYEFSERSSALYSQVARRFTSDIYMAIDGTAADAKDFMGLILLALMSEMSEGRPTLVTFGARGDDAEEAVRVLTDLVSSRRH